MTMEEYIIERLKEAEAQNAVLDDTVRLLAEKNRKVESDLKELLGYLEVKESGIGEAPNNNRIVLSVYEEFEAEQFEAIKAMMERYGIEVACE